MVVDERTQSEIMVDRREKRKEMLSGVVGNRSKPLHLKYPSPEEFIAKMGDQYEKGYDNGREIGEMIGRSKGFWNGVIAGVTFALVMFIIGQFLR